MHALVGSCHSRFPGRLALIVLVAGGLAACASDTTRFRDSPLFNPSTGSVSSDASAHANGPRPGSPIPSGQRLAISRSKQGAGGHTVANAPTGRARAGVHVVVATKQTRPVAQGGHRAGKIKAAAKPPVPPAGPGREVATNDPPDSPHRTTPTEPTVESESGPAGGEPTTGTPSFRWPVRGRIIGGFGPRPNGPHNEGINLAVPEGTSVKAADDGVVAYAGNQLKSYGNMILVRHYNGYVTAYAHASELMVKRGDQVKRGQIIARAGQTGSVSAPQLHFEVRKGRVPVDPTQFLPSI
jgi:murein DD-endopeptidase MepM/ murein hydrolase activator NlpD